MHLVHIASPTEAPAVSPATNEAPPADGGRPRAATVPLDAVRARIEEDDAGKWDVRVKRGLLSLRDGHLEFPLEFPDDQAEGGIAIHSESLWPTDFAFGQLCSRLGIPAHYLRQCPLGLRDANVNHWLRRGGPKGPAPDLPDETEKGGTEEEARDRDAPGGGLPETWLLRARHGSLRAALSTHYSPLDNAALLDAVRTVLPANYRAQWVGLQDTGFHLRLVDPTRPREVLPGDDYFAGIHVANSEVGSRCVTVDAIVYRLVCTNGLVAMVRGKSLMRRRHVHIDRERFETALAEAVADAMSATESLLGSLAGSAKVPVADPETAVRRLARHWGQTEDTADRAVAALLREGPQVQEKAYGVVQAFTHAAQALDDDSRYDLEVLAGHVARHGIPAFATAKEEPVGANAPFRPRPRGFALAGGTR